MEKKLEFELGFEFTINMVKYTVVALPTENIPSYLVQKYYILPKTREFLDLTAKEILALLYAE